MKPKQRARTASRTAGYTYMSVLIIVMIMGIQLALVGKYWHVSQQRVKEHELLFVGSQYRKAIMLYYEKTPGGAKKYPRALDDLLADQRYAATQRYLRRLYRDPMTGSSQWGIIAAPDGGIMGVHSLSDRQPLKVANFKAADQDLEGKARYSDWLFFYVPSPRPAPSPNRQGHNPVTPQGQPQ